LWGLRLALDPEYGMEQKNRNVGSPRNVARHKPAKHQSSEQAVESTLSRLISNIPVMIYRCYDDTGTMEYVSDGSIDLTGYRPSDMIMDHIIAYNDLIHPDDRDFVMSGVQEALQNDRPFKLVYRILDADGREKWVWDQGRGSPVKNGEQSFREGFVTDITARIEANRKLENAWRQADLYLDLIGHDVNNMNQIALGFLELALEKVEQNGKLETMDKDLLEKPFEALKSNSRLVDNLRKIRREISGGIKPALMDLGKTLEEVKKQFTDISLRDITIDYEPADGCFVMANELLPDVFLNLVGNAIKHSSGSLMVNIRLESEDRQEGRYYRVSVEDNGTGIPDAMKKTLLEQACVKRKRKISKGVGLCLVMTLLEDFNGAIWIEDRVPSDHTQGSRFVVLLPAAEK
jgi:PAS domain S-box-containing protein